MRELDLLGFPKKGLQVCARFCHFRGHALSCRAALTPASPRLLFFPLLLATPKPVGLLGLHALCRAFSVGGRGVAGSSGMARWNPASHGTGKTLVPACSRKVHRTLACGSVPFGQPIDWAWICRSGSRRPARPRGPQHNRSNGVPRKRPAHDAFSLLLVSAFLCSLFVVQMQPGREKKTLHFCDNFPSWPPRDYPCWPPGKWLFPSQGAYVCIIHLLHFSFFTAVTLYLEFLPQETFVGTVPICP